MPENDDEETVETEAESLPEALPDEPAGPRLAWFTKPLPRGAEVVDELVGCCIVKMAKWTSTKDGIKRSAEAFEKNGKWRIRLSSVITPGGKPDPRPPEIHTSKGTLTLSKPTKDALRTLMRSGVEAALQGIIDTACGSPDERNRIKATELLCRYGIGERLEVDQNVAPAVVLMIAKDPSQPGWPSMVSVEPERPRLPDPNVIEGEFTPTDRA